MTIEIVDLPMNSMVIFHSYVAVYQRVMLWFMDVYGRCHELVNDLMGFIEQLVIGGHHPVATWVDSWL